MSTSGSNKPCVSVLGLGAMGSVLARTLLQSGYGVTVWNRSPERATALVQEGASLAREASEAINASNLIIICMIDKAASQGVLSSLDPLLNMSGKTIVNMSTGTVDDVQRIAKRVGQHNGLYVDAGIMCYPKDIGGQHTTILYSGNSDAYHAHESTLKVLAGNPKFLGADPAACTPTYLALYAFYFGAFAAWLEGAVLASCAGVSVQDFKALSPIMSNMLVDGIKTAADRIAASDFAGEQASVDVHVAGQEVVLDALQRANAPHASTDAYLSYCRLAQTAGMGELDIASLFNAMHP